ncbi:hypothetical protein ACFSJ3_12965 [Corallincola platygyrae]|uniref:Uncharacterized protein n=1 Tax=Corallincola platygyrae TaxID=1193278 RepID=A0ABW4XPJ5_9GAMM
MKSKLSTNKRDRSVSLVNSALRPKRTGSNMHEGIGDWCDTCVCEAEPYWAEVADELGISLSDYEDDGV